MGPADNDLAGARKTGGYGNVTFYYSEGSGVGYTASDIRVSSLGTDFTVTAPDGETERYQMKLVGAHNVINVMGAIAVANRFGIALKDLRKILIQSGVQLANMILVFRRINNQIEAGNTESNFICHNGYTLPYIQLLHIYPYKLYYTDIVKSTQVLVD